MSTGFLSVDLDALATNWRALDAMTDAETCAVVKADGYGLGAGKVARALAKAGVKRFFVAVAEEGVELRQALGPNVEICVFSGHMRGDTDMIADMVLTPMCNTVGQLTRHLEALPEHPFGVQLDTGMNRLGLEIGEWASVAEIALAQNCRLVMSHLACADEPDHPMNRQQLEQFHLMTDGISVPRSLAATGGILLGPEYHFDLTRPGVGLYGGMPFADAQPVAFLDLPVIQIRELEVGETVGYGNAWTAKRPSKIATVSGGYADGLHRALSAGVDLWHGSQSVPVVGRVSMDLITVDVTDLPELPGSLSVLGPDQTVDALAAKAGTIGYEILTSLGARYARRYAGG
ncbi:alanine racemase [Octadecabacter sp. 1_MG-2023]|uniref:alanine racemase n=1 Tax=unclassified Octadecabacter TaxID=196158 RepID=UPI001C09D07F|nr:MULTISPECIES: alanine racemase [unclassified Octadecabacter]MBU2993767.1 alanine racemase [Octadecabacter sp. B2R22]MDO6735388.1 alanine racemase [Octadecabacter sp. 1_MG-2023]